jgi:hypothetical protein
MTRLKITVAYLAIAWAVSRYANVTQGATPEQLCRPQTVTGIGFSESSKSKAQEQAYDRWEASALQSFAEAYKWKDANDRQEEVPKRAVPSRAA